MKQCYFNKKLLIQSVLASTLFGLWSFNAQAQMTTLATAQNGSNSGLYPEGGKGYNFIDNNVTFTIQNNYVIGNAGVAGVSLDNDNGDNTAPDCNDGACTGDELIFIGNSTVTGSVGPSNPMHD